MRYRNYIYILIISLVLYLPGIVAIPVIDRDEGQYAQVTKQMLESGNYTKIMFRDALFSNKPIGMYWAQSISVSLFSSSDINVIWPYRIPSLISMILSAMAIYCLFEKVFGGKISLSAAIIFESCFHSILEAHIAKSDSLLLLATIIVQGIAFNVALGNISNTFFLWLFFAIGILLKGPVVPFIFVVTVYVYSYFSSDYKLILRLKPFYGCLVVLTCIAPWLFYYYKQTGLFFIESLLV